VQSQQATFGQAQSFGRAVTHIIRSSEVPTAAASSHKHHSCIASFWLATQPSSKAPLPTAKALQAVLRCCDPPSISVLSKLGHIPQQAAHSPAAPARSCPGPSHRPAAAGRLCAGQPARPRAGGAAADPTAAQGWLRSSSSGCTRVSIPCQSRRKQTHTHEALHCLSQLNNTYDTLCLRSITWVTLATQPQS
jgi:hypothetical protein